MNPVLELRNVSKKFPGVQALDGVHFEVLPGEVHALLGENGAGKSTLIKIVSGVYKPDTGDIAIDGQRITFNNPREAQAKGVATIYQELILYPELTVAENIFMGHMPRGPLGIVNWGEMRRRAREVLHSLEIYDMDVNSKVGAMSIGKRQRVEIAKALSQNARILIMDEPTAALTEADVQRLFSIVRLLRERGVSIIYISHRLEEVFMLADRVTVLRDGQYVGTKPVKETNERELISMMVGRTIDNLYPKVPATVGNTVLKVDNLWRKPMTRGVSLELRAGEIVGLAGLVGSGRTELAHVLFGVTPAQSGTITLEGKPVHINNPGHAMKLGIAYVPEDRGNQGLIKQMRIRENVSLAVLRSLVKGGMIDGGAERSLAERSIQQLSIRTPSAEQIVNKLSGGNQQKVVVSKWLASKPKLLIMDEPTRGVDVGAKAEIHHLISELAQQGLAILMISSELPEIMGMSDRILVMREGQLVADYPREGTTQEHIASAMMGERSAEKVKV
ncbi:MAG: sugar ABC transporter ATP-binding protein [Anaerolineae bacterium]